MRYNNLILFFFLFANAIAFSQNSTTNPEEKSNGIDTTAVSPRINLDSIALAKSSEMLDEETYWEIIEKSIKENVNQEDQELFLTAEMEKLSPKEMIGFRLRTDKLLFDSYNSNLWCAVYIIGNGCTDDGFEYFRCWLISRGKEAYYKVKENPDYLINLVGDVSQKYDFEGFWYVAVNAFKNATDRDLNAYIDYDNFTTNDGNYPLLEFNWNVDEPKTMEKVCPVLFKKFWK